MIWCVIGTTLLVPTFLIDLFTPFLINLVLVLVLRHQDWIVGANGPLVDLHFARTWVCRITGASPICIPWEIHRDWFGKFETLWAAIELLTRNCLGITAVEWNLEIVGEPTKGFNASTFTATSRLSRVLTVTFLVDYQWCWTKYTTCWLTWQYKWW